MNYYQDLVAQKVYGKRFCELYGKERAQINTYIQHKGRYFIGKRPDAIVADFKKVLDSKKKYEKAFNEKFLEI